MRVSQEKSPSNLSYISKCVSNLFHFAIIVGCRFEFYVGTLHCKSIHDEFRPHFNFQLEQQIELVLIFYWVTITMKDLFFLLIVTVIITKRLLIAGHHMQLPLAWGRHDCYELVLGVRCARDSNSVLHVICYYFHVS